MKKSNDDPNDQAWFEDHITKAVTRFDAIHAPRIPEPMQFETLVEGHKKEMRRKLWKELLVLWLIACVVMSLMLWMTAEHNFVFFVIFQASIAVIGIGISCVAFGRGKVQTWKS